MKREYKVQKRVVKDPHTGHIYLAGSFDAPEGRGVSVRCRPIGARDIGDDVWDGIVHSIEEYLDSEIGGFLYGKRTIAASWMEDVVRIDRDKVRDVAAALRDCVHISAYEIDPSELPRLRSKGQ